MEHEAEVDHLVKSENGAKSLTEHVDTIGDAFLYCCLSFLLAVDVVEGAVGGGHTLHPTQPHAKFSVVRNYLNIQVLLQSSHVLTDEHAFVLGIKRAWFLLHWADLHHEDTEVNKDERMSFNDRDFPLHAPQLLPKIF